MLVIESCGGGSARHVVDLAAGLLEQGQCVEVTFSPHRADRWFVDELEALPRIVLHRLHMQRELGPHDISAAFALRKLLRQCGPFDIVHGHSAKAGALVRLAGAGLPGKKIYTAHAFITLDPELSVAKRLIYTTAERLLGALADAIICVSAEEQQHARALGLPDQRLVTVENGLKPLPPADRSAARSTLGVATTAVCAGFVGRVSGQKALDRLVNAFALLHGRYPELVLAVVGDGADLPAVRELAARLQVADRIRFMGAADGVALMAGFDLFALSSNYEAFPYVYLEALARGLPIVTTDVGGASAVVDEGVNGYIVPTGDVHRLADAIGSLANDAELRRRMSAAALQKSRSKTLDAMVSSTLAVYRRTLQSH